MNKPEPPDELREVWRCIEWNLSSDYSEAQVLEAVLAFEKFYSTREFHKCINRYGREVSVVVFVPEMLCRGGTPSELLEKLSISLHAHAKKFIKEATL
ncbi:MAG: hypothetical protein KKH61_20430 [Gammaproteobacteria bacterium]|nr:hypothetical protein [Gammaproteobacteria bacterium]